VRSIFPPPSSLKQLEDVLHEAWFSTPLETIENWYESIPRRIQAILRANCGPTPYYYRNVYLSQLFSLFCPSPVAWSVTNCGQCEWASVLIRSKFPLVVMSRFVLGLIQPSGHWLKHKWFKHEADHLSPSNTKVCYATKCILFKLIL